MAPKRTLFDFQQDCGRTKPKRHCTGLNEILNSNGLGEPVCKKLPLSRDNRVANLKKRFANIISKSQQELQKCGEKGCTFDKEENLIFEEKRMIEIRLKIAENDAKNAELDRCMKIKKEREAFRFALEKMEASFESNDFNHVAKDLMKLGCQDLSFYVLGQIGLFLKDDDYDLHQINQLPALTVEDLEEGEIRT